MSKINRKILKKKKKREREKERVKKKKQPMTEKLFQISELI